jgi:hypothetical protein
VTRTLVAVHVLLSVTWLGIDVGVATTALLVARADLDPDARRAFDRLRRWLELGPRASVVLTVPLVVTLLWSTGRGLGVAAVAVAWAAAGAWLLLVGVVFAREMRSLPDGSRTVAGGVETTLRAVVVAVFAAAGISSLAGSGPLDEPHLAAKALVFAAVVAAGTWSRAAGRRLGTCAQTRDDRPGMPVGSLIVASVLVWVGLLANVYLALLGR